MPNATRLLLTFAAAAASLAGMGCSSTPDEPARATVTSLIRTGSQAGNCPVTGGSAGFWQIVGSGNDKFVKNGGDQSGASVGVECSVKGDDTSGYSVLAQATLAGQGGVNFAGTLQQSTNTQKGISGTFSSAQGYGVFKDTNCTIALTAIGPGHMTGHLECPNGVDDTTVGHACVGESDFDFEYCSK